MTLDFLKTLFPAEAGGVTGWIPMWFVEKNLGEIKALVKQHELVRRYRGPRRSRRATQTLKGDAVAMVLYHNGPRPMLWYKS